MLCVSYKRVVDIMKPNVPDVSVSQNAESLHECPYMLRAKTELRCLIVRNVHVSSYSVVTDYLPLPFIAL